MKLTFSGVGAGFSVRNIGHTSAFFEQNDGKDLYFIDCPMSMFYYGQEEGLFDKYENYYCFITHTHPDHISGLTLTAQLLFFTKGKKLHIIAPSDAVKEDIITLMRIEGNEDDWCELQTAETFKASETNKCLMAEVPTTHSPQLAGKCFGYVFSLDSGIVVYTGDTSTLKPFYPFIVNGAEVYVDTSVHYGQIHVKLDEILKDEELKRYRVTTYLMHLDHFGDAVAAVKASKREDIKVIIKENICMNMNET